MTLFLGILAAFLTGGVAGLVFKGLSGAKKSEGEDEHDRDEHDHDYDPKGRKKKRTRGKDDPGKDDPEDEIDDEEDLEEDPEKKKTNKSEEGKKDNKVNEEKITAYRNSLLNPTFNGMTLDEYINEKLVTYGYDPNPATTDLASQLVRESMMNAWKKMSASALRKVDYIERDLIDSGLEEIEETLPTFSLERFVKKSAILGEVVRGTEEKYKIYEETLEEVEDEMSMYSGPAMERAKEKIREEFRNKWLKKVSDIKLIEGESTHDIESFRESADKMITRSKEKLQEVKFRQSVGNLFKRVGKLEIGAKELAEGLQKIKEEDLPALRDEFKKYSSDELEKLTKRLDELADAKDIALEAKNKADVIGKFVDAERKERLQLAKKVSELDNENRHIIFNLLPQVETYAEHITDVLSKELQEKFAKDLQAVLDSNKKLTEEQQKQIEDILGRLGKAEDRVGTLEARVKELNEKLSEFKDSVSKDSKSAWEMMDLLLKNDSEVLRKANEDSNAVFDMLIEAVENITNRYASLTPEQIKKFEEGLVKLEKLGVKVDHTVKAVMILNKGLSNFKKELADFKGEISKDNKSIWEMMDLLLDNDDEVLKKANSETNAVFDMLVNVVNKLTDNMDSLTAEQRKNIMEVNEKFDRIGIKVNHVAKVVIVLNENLTEFREKVTKDSNSAWEMMDLLLQRDDEILKIALETNDANFDLLVDANNMLHKDMSKLSDEQKNKLAEVDKKLESLRKQVVNTFDKFDKEFDKLRKAYNEDKIERTEFKKLLGDTIERLDDVEERLGDLDFSEIAELVSNLYELEGILEALKIDVNDKVYEVINERKAEIIEYVCSLVNNRVIGKRVGEYLATASGKKRVDKALDEQAQKHIDKILNEMTKDNMDEEQFKEFMDKVVADLAKRLDSSRNQ